MYDETLIMTTVKNQCQQEFESHVFLLKYIYPNNEILMKWLMSSLWSGICGFITKLLIILLYTMGKNMVQGNHHVADIGSSFLGTEEI